MSSSSASEQETSQQDAEQQQKQAHQYKRRKRVYEKIKHKQQSQSYQPLATVPEGAVLREASSWLGPTKFVGFLVIVLIAVAFVKEGSIAMGNALSAGGDAAKTKAAAQRGHPEEGEDEDEATTMPNVRIPDNLRFFPDVSEPLRFSDRAFFWHVPRSSAATIKAVAAHCFGLLLATEQGASSTEKDKISIITDLDGGTFINVDPSTPDGIDHAVELNAALLPGLNFVSSSYFYKAAEGMFTQQYRGRCITMLRHPVDRAVSLYHHLQQNENAGFGSLTLEEYANSDRVERNWMTRFLSNNIEDELSPTRDLALAKTVLEQKCVVGLLKHKAESMRRFETYFGWTIDGEKVSDCHTKLLDWNWPNKNKHDVLKENSPVWKKLAEVNDLDMRLFKHSQSVYKKQGKQLFSK